MAEVNGQLAGRKVWVVRVPPHVAKQWRQALALAAADDSPVDEDTADASVLGHLTLEEGNPTTLKVQGLDDEEQLLYMNPNRDTVDATVLSYELAESGAIADAKVEGVAFKRFDAAPVKLSDGARTPGSLSAGQQRQQPAAGKVDSDYLKQTRARLAAAAKPAQKRKVAVLEDDLEINQLAGGTKDLPLYVKNRQKKKAQTASTSRKREKLTKDELESELFNLFATQQHWHFTQLQKTLDQPVASIKEVLVTIADQVKRGPNKDLWELKAHYKTTAAQQRQTAAAAAAAAGSGG